MRSATYASWTDINASRGRVCGRTYSLLKSVLDRAAGEREMMRFFKRHPHVVAFSEFWWGHNDLYVFFEFPLAAERCVDILVLGCHSGGWCPTLIEVQDPNAKLFLANGDPGPQLREGVRQIGQWREFLNRNTDCFRQELSRRLPEDAVAYSIDHTNARAEVLDPRQQFEFSYWVLVGRSGKMSGTDQSHRRIHAGILDEVEIASFDRLLNHWRRIDGMLSRR